MIMDRQIELTSGGEIIYDDSISNIISALNGDGNPHMDKDIRESLEWLAGQNGGTEKVSIDFVKLVNEADMLDGMKTRAIFWLSAMLMRNGGFRKLPPEMLFRIMPFIQNKTAAAQVNLNNLHKKADTLHLFADTVRKAVQGISSGDFTPDEAAEIIIEKMPDKKLMIDEANERKELKNVLIGVREIADTCADGSLTEQIYDMTDFIDK